MIATKYFISAIILLGRCVNIAPGEKCHNDDTRIWIKYASSLDLPENGFKERDTTASFIILDYEKDSEDSIKRQIINSPHFNMTTIYEPTAELWKQANDEKLFGLWHKTNKGYKFIQIPGNQYPMTIEMDTVKKQILIERQN